MPMKFQKFKNLRPPKQTSGEFPQILEHTVMGSESSNIQAKSWLEDMSRSCQVDSLNTQPHTHVRYLETTQK